MERVNKSGPKRGFTFQEPLVYTKRLEDMTILKLNDLSKLVYEDVIETVTIESKPRYVQKQKPAQNLNRIIQGKKCFRALKLKRIRYSENNQGTLCTKDVIEYPSNKQLKLANSEHLPNNNRSESANEFQNSPIRVQTGDVPILKELKVVLQDFRKLSRGKTADNINKQIEFNASVNIANVINLLKSQIICDGGNLQSPKRHVKQEPNENETKNDEKKDSNKYIIKNVHEFKSNIEQHGIQNTIILMYNLFLKTLDTYHIGDMYNVIDFARIAYSRFHSLKMKPYKSIFHIEACCWKNRQLYVYILRSLKYSDIAQFMYTPHRCEPRRCNCCCSNVEDGDVNKISDLIVKINERLSDNNSKSNNISQTIQSNKYIKQNGSLISNALQFSMRSKKEAKWIGGHEIPNGRSNNNCSYNFTKLLHLKNVNNGTEEFYESGDNDIIYSKVINSGRDESCWLLKTLSVPETKQFYEYSDLASRETCISLIKNSSYIPLSNYLKLSNPVCNKNKIPSIPPIFIINKNTLEVSKVSYVNEITNFNTTDDTTQNVNCLISDILRRFRDVKLTINDEGKVSVAMNTSLNSLSSSELKILDEIIQCAQKQVDEIGLKSATCLDSNGALFINTPSPYITMNTDTTHLHSSMSTTKCLNTGSGLDPNKAVVPSSTLINTHTNKETSNNVMSTLNAPPIDNFVNTGPCLDPVSTAPFIIPSAITTDTGTVLLTPIGTISEYNTKSNPDKNPDSQVLSRFSKLICKKKKEYGHSFRSYMDKDIEVMPKITTIFSLNNFISDTSNNTENERNKTVVKSTNESNKIKNLCLKEIELSMKLLDSEPQSLDGTSNKRTQKQSDKMKDAKKPKKA